MIPAIDAHHHLWRYDPAEYGWIDDSMSSLRRDFLPSYLHAEMPAAGVLSTVAVQARQSLAETAWLLSLAAQNPWIAGVVGWAPIAAPDFPHQLEPLLHHPKLKALRHVLQSEPDPSYALHPGFQRGLAALRATGLVYDILICASQLPIAIQLVDAHPHQLFVLDHLAKPRIAAAELSPWREQIRDLARRPNVSCKLSGMVTEADWWHWTPEHLRPYLDTALEAFGPHRLLAGSDWPVCTVASTYRRWWQILRAWAANLSHDEQRQILARNAEETYRLHI